MEVPTRWSHGLDCNTGEPQTGFPRLVPLTAEIDTGLQYHTENVIGLAVERCTALATCSGELVVVFADLASNRVGTETEGRALAMLSTAGLGHNHSFPARVDSLSLQIKGQKSMAE